MVRDLFIFLKVLQSNITTELNRLNKSRYTENNNDYHSYSHLSTCTIYKVFINVIHQNRSYTLFFGGKR